MVWIGWQLSDALANAHRQGILHCDVKPANVLLAKDGQPRLLDFNVAHTTDQPTACAPLGGTLPYMSPEHKRAMQSDETIDGRSDVYSLGVVLYEMLTGELPEKNASLPSILARMQQCNPAISKATQHIVGKCLQTDREERYASAQALSEDLESQYLDLPLVHQPEPSLWERTAKWARRHPRLSSTASTSALAGLLVLVLVGLLVWRGANLRKLKWEQNRDQFALRLPRSMAYLTSAAIAPELRSEMVKDLSATLAFCTRPKGMSGQGNGGSTEGVPAEFVLAPDWADYFKTMGKKLPSIATLR